MIIELLLFCCFQGCRPPEMLPIVTPPVPPPPPAPIPPLYNEKITSKENNLRESSSTAPQSAPAKIEKEHKPFTHQHHNINRGGGNTLNTNNVKENVVDSLTTWHYNTANISTNRNHLNKFDTPPQSIASINGRKFIVVPKTNVLSVSPSSELKSHHDDARGDSGLQAGVHSSDNCGGIGGGGVIGNGDYAM